jgi:hypothetical protein
VIQPESRVFIAKSGEEYTFLFTHRGLIAAEKSADAGLGKVLQGLSEGRIGFVVALIHGGLVVNHPEMLQEDAWALWEEEGPRLVEAMSEALKAAMPIVQQVLGVAGKNPPKARSGTGTPSSRSGSKKASTKVGS